MKNLFAVYNDDGSLRRVVRVTTAVQQTAIRVRECLIGEYGEPEYIRVRRITRVPSGVYGVGKITLN